MKRVEVYSDGIAEPNPGHACWAWLAKLDGEILAKDFGYIGPRSTNNVAEYFGVGHALKWLNGRPEEFIIDFYSDSKLVLNQVSGAWACNKEELQKLRDRCRELIAGLSIKLAWISGDANPADELTREAYRRHVGEEPRNRHKRAGPADVCPVCGGAVEERRGARFMHLWCARPGHFDAWRAMPGDKLREASLFDEWKGREKGQ